MYKFISHVKPWFTQQVTTEVEDWHALLKCTLFVFWLKKNRFLFSLACELPFKARDLVTILKETILLHILILLWKKILSVLCFWTNQSMSFGDLNCEKHIIICFEIYWYCCMYMSKHIQFSRICITHLSWHMTSQSYHGFQVTFFQLNICFVISWLFYWVFTPSHC